MLAHLESVLQKKNWKLQSYIIAREQHKDGNSHIHCWLRLEKKINITNNRLFDLDGYHPNIQGVKSNQAVIKYVTKENDYISSESEESLQQQVKARVGHKAVIG